MGNFCSANDEKQSILQKEDGEAEAKNADVKTNKNGATSVKQDDDVPNQRETFLRKAFTYFDKSNSGTVSTAEISARYKFLERGEVPEAGETLDFDAFVIFMDKLQKKKTLNPKRKIAFLTIDVQNDFCPPDGSLAVPEGADIVPTINKIRAENKFDMICHTKDWHPAHHISFYVNHKDDPEAKVFVPYKLENGSMQVLWPAHCIQGSKGSDFHPDLVTEESDTVVYKGTDANVDSYSGFMDNDKKTKSELGPLLLKEGVTDVFLVGLAYDYCVGFSCIDCDSLGIQTYLIEDCARGITPEGIADMKGALYTAGVDIIQSSEVASVLERIRA